MLREKKKNHVEEEGLETKIRGEKVRAHQYANQEIMEGVDIEVERLVVQKHALLISYY